MFVRGGNAATEILRLGCGHNAERGLIANRGNDVAVLTLGEKTIQEVNKWIIRKQMRTSVRLRL